MHYMGVTAVSDCTLAMLALCRMYLALRTLMLPQPPFIKKAPVYLQIYTTHRAAAEASLERRCAAAMTGWGALGACAVEAAAAPAAAAAMILRRGPSAATPRSHRSYI